MTVGTFWQTHFKKGTNTYRWFRKLILTPNNLQEWTEINIKEENICRIVNNGEEITDQEKIDWFMYINFAGTPQERSHFNKLK